MKKSGLISLIFIFGLSLILTGCKEDMDISSIGYYQKTGETTSLGICQNSSVSGSGAINHVDNRCDGGSFDYTHNIGSTAQDVYFIFSNLNSQSKNSPGISLRTTAAQSVIPYSGVAENWDVRETPKQDDPVKIAIDQYNANPPALIIANNTELSASTASKQQNKRSTSASIGTSYSFINDSVNSTIPATLRAQRSVGSQTVRIWVGDASWGSGCSKKYCMTQTMVDLYLNKFLLTGNNNDIFDWVTNIFDQPWGSHNITNLIPASAKDTIDILFFDISNDNKDLTSKGGLITGFYWAKDNFLSSSDSRSNERLIFYMDSVLAASFEGSSWDISDEGPAEIVSTLAHEFQHMIHFYQKIIAQTNAGKQATGTETWLNEMLSLITEDFIADKLTVNGPRGVNYSDGTAGSADNKNGRLPYFNQYSETSLTKWYSTVIDYSVSYSFGAYLARNYGGVNFFRKIMKNAGTGTNAVTQALKDSGYENETFESVFQKWSVANMLSDRTNTEQGYQLNINDYFTSAINGVNYRLGSINLLNYNPAPRCYSINSIATKYGGLSATSNTCVKVVENATGAFTSKITLPAGVRLTVITR